MDAIQAQFRQALTATDPVAAIHDTIEQLALTGMGIDLALQEFYVFQFSGGFSQDHLDVLLEAQETHPFIKQGYTPVYEPELWAALDSEDPFKNLKAAVEQLRRDHIRKAVIMEELQYLRARAAQQDWMLEDTILEVMDCVLCVGCCID